MRIIISSVLALIVMASCGTQQQPEAQSAADTKTGGQIGDSTWTMSSAVVFNENNSFDITIAGSGDTISCANPVPSKTHLSFRVPNRLGKYEFNLSNPNTNPVFFVFSKGGKVEVKIAKESMVEIAKESMVEITSFNPSKLNGSVIAESSGTGATSGKVSGSFEAVLCPSK
jgi:hypothetical protein